MIRESRHAGRHSSARASARALTLVRDRARYFSQLAHICHLLANVGLLTFLSPRLPVGLHDPSSKDYLVQSSVLTRLIRRNAASFVTSTASATSACAAIIKSRFPTG